MGLASVSGFAGGNMPTCLSRLSCHIRYRIKSIHIIHYIEGWIDLLYPRLSFSFERWSRQVHLPPLSNLGGFTETQESPTSTPKAASNDMYALTPLHRSHRLKDLAEKGFSSKIIEKRWSPPFCELTGQLLQESRQHRHNARRNKKQGQG